MINNQNPINKEFFILCLISTGIFFLGISNQSLWIDEAWTAFFASQHNIADLITALKKLNAPDIQTPLYLVYTQGWGKLFGTTEYALRLSNLPFGIILAIALGWTSRVGFGRQYLWVGFCFSPFIWFYMNEARPYMALMAFGALSVGAVIVYFENPNKYAKYAPWLTLSSLLIACGFHMLAAFLLPALLVLAVFWLKEKQMLFRKLRSDWQWALVFHMPLMIILGGFYIWTVISGAGGIREEPGFSNVAFVFYEFLGFMGLGPPRNDLRTGQKFISFIGYWPWLLIGLGALVGIFIVAIWNIWYRSHFPWAMAWSFLISLVLLFLASYIVKFRFLGRHFAVLYPLFLFMGMNLMNNASRETRWRYIEKIAFLTLALVWIISDIRMWALPEYFKEDYRSAAIIALEKSTGRDEKIVWAADPMAGRYYGIHFGDGERSDVSWSIRAEGIIGINWDKTQTINFIEDVLEKSSIIIVLSKADLYDRKKGWAYAIQNTDAEQIASINGFKIYEIRRKIKSRG